MLQILLIKKTLLVDINVIYTRMHSLCHFVIHVQAMALLIVAIDLTLLGVYSGWWSALVFSSALKT